MPPQPSAVLDVDARFLLANERTLLAWVRTSLTVLAAGVAVAELGPDGPLRFVLAVLLIVVGACAAAEGARRFSRADSAIRGGVLPLTGRAPYLLAAVVVLAAVLLLVAVVVAA